MSFLRSSFRLVGRSNSNIFFDFWGAEIFEMGVKYNLRERDPTTSSSGGNVANHFFSSSISPIYSGSQSVMDVDEGIDDVFVGIIRLIRFVPYEPESELNDQTNSELEISNRKLSIIVFRPGLVR